MKETNARPETLLPAELWCTKKPTEDITDMSGKDYNNDGEYEVIIPLIYMTEALKSPAKFYKFIFKGLRYKEK